VLIEESQDILEVKAASPESELFAEKIGRRIRPPNITLDVSGQHVCRHRDIASAL